MPQIITKNKSQGVIFVLISCQILIVEKILSSWRRLLKACFGKRGFCKVQCLEGQLLEEGKDPHPQDKIQHLVFTKDPRPLYYKTPPCVFYHKNVCSKAVFGP